MAGVNGVSAYQQTNKTWNNYSNKSAEVDKKTDKVENKKTEDNVKVSEWKPVTNNSLIPTQKEGMKKNERNRKKSLPEWLLRMRQGRSRLKRRSAELQLPPLLQLLLLFVCSPFMSFLRFSPTTKEETIRDKPQAEPLPSRMTRVKKTIEKARRLYQRMTSAKEY